MTLEELKTQWDQMKKCGSDPGFDMYHLNDTYHKALDCVKDNIADFMVAESANIKKLYEMTESCDKMFNCRSMTFPVKNFNEYSEGLTAYIDDICNKKDVDESFYSEMIEDVVNTTDASNTFVRKLFSNEENPRTEIPLDNALCCVESLADIYEKCNEYRECGDAIKSTLDVCGNGDCQNHLADLYYKTNCSYLTDYVNECMNTYLYVKDCALNPTPEVIPEKPQVF